ncbi:23362_t:CDS:2, partial [Gigaspora rosea]
MLKRTYSDPTSRSYFENTTGRKYSNRVTFLSSKKERGHCQAIDNVNRICLQACRIKSYMTIP